MLRHLCLSALALLAVAACTPITNPHPLSMQRSQLFKDVRICTPSNAWNEALEPIVRPFPVRCAGPHYPMALRQARREGSSVARVWINPDGVPDVASITFIEVSAHEIELGVREAISHIRFAPRESGGRMLVEFQHSFALASSAASR